MRTDLDDRPPISQLFKHQAIVAVPAALLLWFSYWLGHAVAGAWWLIPFVPGVAAAWIVGQFSGMIQRHLAEDRALAARRVAFVRRPGPEYLASTYVARFTANIEEAEAFSDSYSARDAARRLRLDGAEVIDGTMLDFVRGKLQ